MGSITRSGLAESCGYPVPRGIVLSHPRSREPVRKGEVVRKVKPENRGLSRIKLLRAPRFSDTQREELLSISRWADPQS